MLQLSHPITSINGFKIGDRVRLKDGDGRPHIIKSFSIDGMKEFFFEVQFEDGTETMLDNIAPLTSEPSISSNLDREEIVEAISDDKMMPYIEPYQLSEIVDFVIKNYKPYLPTIKGWVARDSVEDAFNGCGLILHCKKPWRAGGEWSNQTIAMHLPGSMFPDLKWEDEPIEVELQIRPLNYANL